ncbi:MAG: tetratricopeptide repeat protein [Rhodospirillales bacterium]|nr:tetratricopeptide repeat protein [Rhodospirillales bacterium]
MRYRVPFFAAALLMPLAASAQPLIQSQEGIALQNEILQLQQQIQQLQTQGGGNGASSLGGNAAPPPNSASGNSLVPTLLTQVQQLQAQVQTLNGEVSDLQHQVQTQNDQTQKEIGDLKFQMGGTPAGAPGTAPGATPGPQAGTAPSLAPPAPPATAPSDPKAALQAAIAAYGRHDYATAQKLAQGIVTNNKSAPQAYRAQYLVAQSYAAEGDSQSAAVAYYNSYNMNKNGTYAPHSMLGLASSLAAIHQDQEACETLASLNSQFTTPSAGMKSDIDAVSERAHCQ